MTTSTTGPAPETSALTSESFWTDFLNLMEPEGLTSDVGYYTSGQAGPADYANAITVIFERTAPSSPERQAVIDLLSDAGFWDPNDDLDFWLNQDVNSADINDLVNAGMRRLPKLFDAEGNLNEGQGDQKQQTATDPTGGAGDDPETVLSILKGQDMKWYRDPNTGKYYVSYGLPNSSKRAVFEATEDQMDALFGVGVRPQTENATLNTLINVQDGIFSGNVSEMEGDGSFEAEVERVTSLGLDAGRLPDWMTDSPEALDIVYLAQAEGWTTERTINALSDTEAFKVRFPGLDAFRSQANLSVAEAVAGFLEMESGIRHALTSAGYSADMVSPQVTGALLGQGYSLKQINTVVSSFRRAQNFAPALDAFNEVLVASGFDPMSTIDEMLAFISGEAPQEMYDLWEAASFQEAAAAAGLDDLFDTQDAINAALQTPGVSSLGDVSSAMQEAARLLLRLRSELDVGSFGLDHEELIDLSLGLTPASGRSIAEIEEGVNRAVATARGFVQTKRLQPFTGFTQEGTPQDVSLSRARTQT